MADCEGNVNVICRFLSFYENMCILKTFLPSLVSVDEMDNREVLSGHLQTLPENILDVEINYEIVHQCIVSHKFSCI